MNTLKKEWNVEFTIAGSERNAGGVLVAIDSNFEHIIHSKKSSIDGRYVIIDLEIPEVARFLIVDLYAPNEDSPIFFENLFNIIEEMETKNIILVGDWNLVNDFNLDTLNYKKRNNQKASQIVRHYKEKLDLVDIWRQSNPELKQFTWKQLFYKKMARLDFFLISESLLNIYAESKIKNSYKSDHSPINLKLNVSKFERGKGNWKLNNSLLLDLTLKKKIENEIELIISTYACTPYSPEFVKKNYNILEIDLMIDIELLWEVMHAQLRSVIIPYAANKKRKQNIREHSLEKEIEKMEFKLPEYMDNEI